MAVDFYSDVLTLYCSFGRGAEQKWQSFILRGVGFEELIGEKLRRNAFSNLDAARIFIPAKEELERVYMSGEAWQAANEEQRKGKWTLQAGDIFVPGECEVSIEKSPAELAAKGRRMYIIARVEAFLGAGASKALRHWEVTSSAELKGEGRRWGY